jgi:hypothetical protein
VKLWYFKYPTCTKPQNVVRNFKRIIQNHTNPFMNHFRIFFVSAIALCLFSCSPSYETYPPEFTDNGATVQSLKNKYGMESIEFEAYPKVDTADSVLSISLVNDKTKPPLESRNTFVKEIARQIKDVLKTPEKYNSYIIVFVNRQTDGLISGDSFETTEILAKDL